MAKRPRTLAWAILAETWPGLVLVVPIALLALGTIPLREGIIVGIVLAVGGPYAWLRYKRIRLRSAYRVVALRALSVERFHATVDELLREFGYRDLRGQVHTGEPWSEIHCADRFGRSVLVRCQRMESGRQIRARDVKQFVYQLRHRHTRERGILVTTSNVTLPAERICRKHHVHVIDGPTLGRLVADAREHHETGHRIPIWDRFEL